MILIGYNRISALNIDRDRQFVGFSTIVHTELVAGGIQQYGYIINYTFCRQISV
jgi:hypothetical protein